MMKANNAFNVILRVPVMLLALSCLYSLTESETSYTWKLDAGIGKIMPDEVLKAEDKNQELMLDILMSTVANPDGMWKKTASVAYCSNCPNKSVLGKELVVHMLRDKLTQQKCQKSTCSGVS
jgi:hypothetical protein